MLANIKSISLSDLINNEELEQASKVFLSSSQDFDAICEYFENEATTVFLTLEHEDLSSKIVLLSAIFSATLEQEAEELGIAQLYDAIEEELGELDCCLLFVPFFASLESETQAMILEVAMGSPHFKLYLPAQASIFENNLSFWKTLLKRSLLLENVKAAAYTPIDESELESIQASSDDLTGEEQQPWYQLIPKYHLAAAIVVLITVVALWNMDLNQTRNETIELNKEDGVESKPVLEVTEKTEPVQETTQENNIDVAEEAQQVSHRSPEAENVEALAVHENDRGSKPGLEKEVVVEEAPREPEEQPLREEIVESEAPTGTGLKPQWQPFQSYDWINALDSRYFTLQLMASHSEQGIRDFLLERGVSSEYAVYTTTKDGKPWHVVIYGVYETRDFADSARMNLPSYLQAYSPWIRSISDIQKSIQ